MWFLYVVEEYLEQIFFPLILIITNYSYAKKSMY
nr:MAG TPA: hypothetical protein [Caudoviricetes sp.]